MNTMREAMKSAGFSTRRAIIPDRERRNVKLRKLIDTALTLVKYHAKQNACVKNWNFSVLAKKEGEQIFYMIFSSRGATNWMTPNWNF